MAFEQSLRIGITGSSSTGKTQLVNDLGDRLGVAVVREEVRHFLESREVHPHGGFGSLPLPERRSALEEMYAQRVRVERSLESFVADNTALDFTAYALHHRIYDSFDSADQAPLLTEPARVIGSYDAVFVLPHGALPYVRDKVRSDEPLSELRFQHLLESSLRRSYSPHRTHFVPRSCTSRGDRLRFVLAVLTRVGLLEGERKPARLKSTGTVYLVGAGPGNPDLLTVRARELIQHADVVAPDKLIPNELLDTLPQGAEILQVGHRGRGSRTAIHRIHPAVVEAALAGKTVVRLKAGDPMVFGRASEEASELRKANIPFEVVPGISAALGAAAYTGIPLTHRDHASDVTLATGHEASSPRQSHSSWQCLGSSTGTLVLYMAAQRLESSLDRLIAAGRAPSTPAAYVAGATQHNQIVIEGTLADLAQRSKHQDRSQPAIVIIGDVVLERDAARWLESRRPLHGRNLLVARARRGSSRLASELRALGARVLETPMVLESPIDFRDKLSTALALNPSVSLIADQGIWPRLNDAQSRLTQAESRRLNCIPVIALTQAVAEECARLGNPVAFTARGSCTEALKEALSACVGLAPGRILIPGERRARPSLSDALNILGQEVVHLPMYERRYDYPRSNVTSFDGAVFPSSSAVEAAFRDPLSTSWSEVPALSIGPRTSAALQDAGVRWIEQSKEDTIDSLIMLIMEQFGSLPRTCEAHQ